MMDCILIQTENGTYRCTMCGVEYRAMVRVNCKANQPEPHRHSYTTLAARWGKAIARWIAAGRPRRTDEEVAKLLAVCEACPLLIDGHCSHKDCGCQINARKNPLRNKLRMGSETCPAGKWPS